jgi:hypothetical protein
MRQHLDLRSSKTVHEVVDGQQRLNAVLEFRADELPLSQDNAEFAGLTFSQLPKDIQKSFLKYEFSVDLLVDAADADVLDIFARINSYAVPLNGQEKRNAKFFGSFKTTVYKLGFEHLEFWKKHGVLSDMGIARMKEAELVSELLIGMLVGLQDKKKSLDGFYKKWDDRFPYKQKSVERFRDVIDLLDRHFKEELAESAFKRPPLFYSLFLALYEIRYSGLGDEAGSRRAFPERDAGRLRAAVARLDKAIGSEQPPKDLIMFVTASQRQTDNISPRKIRHTSLLTEFRNAS